MKPLVNSTSRFRRCQRVDCTHFIHFHIADAANCSRYCSDACEQLDDAEIRAVEAAILKARVHLAAMYTRLKTKVNL